MKNTIIYYLLLILISSQLSLSAETNSKKLFDNVESSSILYPKNNDAIIISENNTIDILGQKSGLIIFSITKNIKFKVLNSAGVKKFSKFTLPETFDPTYISHFPKDRNYSHAYSSMECNYFKGTITTKEGEKKEAKIKVAIDYINMVMVEKNRYGNFEEYSYQIENLNIGDEVIIEYNYDVKYLENMAKLSSFRVFFNNDVFKKNYRLTIKHHPNLKINIAYENNATPDSIVNKENEKVYYWNKNNLYGCINEEGSRPYLSLPHVIFSIMPNDFLYRIPDSFDEEYMPFYAVFSYAREMNHLGIAKSVHQGLRTNQYLKIDKFVKETTQDITNDSLGYLKLMKIKNTIVDEFAFQNDTDYFNRNDNSDPNMGDYINKKVIRDISRYDIYVALILKLDLEYFTAYVCDKRTGVINNDYFAPMYDSDYMFAVLLKNNLIQYLYPKKEQFGYYLNEMPFYFENTKARLVHLNDYRDTENPIKESLRQAQLPNSQTKENVRRNNIILKVNSDSLSTIFNAKISLKGQYSTLTRGLYQYNHKDKTINELYGKKIWELNDQVKLINQETKVINKEFPFPATVSAQYQFNNLIEANSDTLLLSLKNWFNHIIYNDFDTTNRQLDFYADFCGTDSYVYYIEFDKNIKLISACENIKIKNEFGELLFSVEQLKPNVLKISSFFVIANNSISADKIESVKEIYDNIQKMNNSYLKFKVE